MIDKIDYTKYLSKQTKYGLLISQKDIEVLNHYKIDYQSCTSLKQLIFLIDNQLRNYSQEEAIELEEVLIRLNETYYYQEIKK